MRRIMVAALLIAAALLAPPVAAYDCEDRIDHDHDLARDLYEAGQIRSLADILRIVAVQTPGDVVGISLDCTAERWVYRLQVVDGGGRRDIVSVDAKSGAILRSSGADD